MRSSRFGWHRCACMHETTLQTKPRRPRQLPVTIQTSAPERRRHPEPRSETSSKVKLPRPICLRTLQRPSSLSKADTTRPSSAAPAKSASCRCGPKRLRCSAFEEMAQNSWNRPPISTMVLLYLSRAWRLAGGDLCRALMKYRAGHGEESMTPRSQVYCNRARNRLLAMNSAAGRTEAAAIPASASAPTALAVAPATKSARNQKAETKPKEVYARYRQGTTAASRAYWAAHEARIGLIKARIEAKWRRVASR